MTMRVVFFGSSQNVFSQRFYEALAQTACEIAAVVDVPAGKRSSTNPAQDEARVEFCPRRRPPRPAGLRTDESELAGVCGGDALARAGLVSGRRLHVSA